MKNLIKKLLSSQLVTTLPLVLRNTTRPTDVLVLTYHRVFNGDQYGVPFDTFPTITKEEFEKQLKYLSRNYTFISPQQLADNYFKKEKLPKNPCLLTFDDSYKDILQLVPIIKKYNAHILFFVPTDYLDGNGIFWWDQVWYLVNSVGKDHIALLGEQMDIRTKEEKLQAIGQLKDKMQDMEKEKQNTFFDGIYKEYGIESPQNSMKEQLLSWEELKGLDDSLITIGGHTLSHQVLSKLSETEQWKEVEESKALLESKLGRELVFFSYPYGEPEDYTRATVDIVRTAGYQFGFTQSFGFNGKDQDRFRMKRINVNVGEPLHFTLSGIRQMVQKVKKKSP